jgi:hypothetical protein
MVSDLPVLHAAASWLCQSRAWARPVSVRSAEALPAQAVVCFHYYQNVSFGWSKSGTYGSSVMMRTQRALLFGLVSKQQGVE